MIGEKRFFEKELNSRDSEADDRIDVGEVDVDSECRIEMETDEVIETDAGIDTSDNTKVNDNMDAGSDYSDEVNSYLRSEAELRIYQNAALEETEIGEKKALIRGDINWDKVDEKGRTNSERIERGLAPLDKDGDAIELHHVGQKLDSPLAELTFEEHRGKGNDAILHDKTLQSETHGEGNEWNSERQEYWMNRASYNKEVSESE